MLELSLTPLQGARIPACFRSEEYECPFVPETVCVSRHSPTALNRSDLVHPVPQPVGRLDSRSRGHRIPRCAGVGISYRVESGVGSSTGALPQESMNFSVVSVAPSSAANCEDDSYLIAMRQTSSPPQSRRGCAGFSQHRGGLRSAANLLMEFTSGILPSQQRRSFPPTARKNSP